MNRIIYWSYSGLSNDNTIIVRITIITYYISNKKKRKQTVQCNREVEDSIPP